MPVLLLLNIKVWKWCFCW